MSEKITVYNVRPNVATNFSRVASEPQIGDGSYVCPEGVVIGNVIVGKRVYMGPHSYLRGDEGQPIFVGDDTNIQDCAGMHGLETEVQAEDGSWQYVDGRRFSADGCRLSKEETEIQGYTIWVGSRVSIAHQAQVHGPAWIGNDSFIGMQSLIFNAKIGHNVVVGVKSLVTDGVEVPDNSFIPAGSIITTQEQADNLGKAAGTGFEYLNNAVVHVNTVLATEYPKQGQ